VSALRMPEVAKSSTSLVNMMTCWLSISSISENERKLNLPEEANAQDVAVASWTGYALTVAICEEGVADAKIEERP
jgi:hypothetical protein